MEQLELNIRTLLLNPISAAEVKQHPGERFISEKEVKEFLADIATSLYGVSGLLQTCHKSIDEDESENYTLARVMTLCYKGLHDLAYELDTLENSFKDQITQIIKKVA